MKHVLSFAFCLFLAVLCVSAQDRLFPADAVVDLSKTPYFAIPDDGKDDTAAIQSAITDVLESESGRTLYLPAGIYEISAPLCATNSQGLLRAHLTLQGQGCDKTIVRLRDNSPAFTNAAAPAAMLSTGSLQHEGDDPAGGGNKAFRNYIFDMAFETGRGNPGTIGIDYAVSNFGAIENVKLRDRSSVDRISTAAVGISMRRRIPGPGLLKNVSISGFGIGIAIGDIQYGITAEQIAMSGQREAGVLLGKNLLQIRELTSANSVPAIRVADQLGILTIMDSSLASLNPGNKKPLAIDAQGSVFLRNVRTFECDEQPFRFGGRAHANETNKLLLWPETKTPAPKSFLAVEKTPLFWNETLSDWQAVGDRLEGETDDTAAIQRAVDSGKGTIYLPNNRVYFLSDTIVLRGKVKQILGMGSEISLGSAEKLFSNPDTPRPLFRVDKMESDTVWLERLFFNAQYPGALMILHNSPATLVVRHSGGWIGGGNHKRSYRATPDAKGAKVFVENVFMPGWEFTGQHVWARQFNPENWECDGSEPQVLNRGGTLWILGFKTEGPAPFIVTEEGGRTELYGGYNYVSAIKMHPLPMNRIPYSVSGGSTAFLTFASDNFRQNDDYEIYLRGKRDIPPGELPRRPVSERSVVASGFLLE